MVDFNQYRKFFPHLKHQLYFNHAAIAPQNTRAIEAVQNFYHERSEGNIEYWPEAMDRKQELAGKIADFINAEADNIAFVPNTSSGINLLTLGLNWQPGDRILLNDFEFPSNVVPFHNLKRFQMSIDTVKHRDGQILLEDIKQNIHCSTRVLSISFVEFLNGYKNDLIEIGKICREKDVIFCVDAIQGLGALQMDVEAMQIDFLSSGGHKWLMWPAGLGFAYISPRIMEQVYPAQAGWLSVKTPWHFFDYEQGFADTARRYEPGTVNTTAIIAAGETLGMMQEIGKENLEAKILENTRYLIQELDKRNYQFFTHRDEKFLSGIVSFYHDKAEELFEYLKGKNITVSLREGKIRVSPHFYNNTDDFEKFFDVLGKF